MDIKLIIEKAIAEYKRNNKNRPKAVYLGGSQFFELMKLARNYKVDGYVQTGARRPVVRGLLVYQVDAIDHCVVA